MTTSHRADPDSEWQRKGATLSDKTARKEYGLMQDEIVRAIRARKLQYREGSMFGNPWLRFLRREIEALQPEGARTNTAWSHFDEEFVGKHVPEWSNLIARVGERG